MVGEELFGDVVQFSGEGRVFLEGDEAGEVLPCVSDDHDVGEEGQGGAYLVFDEDWGYVLSSCRDDEFLDSAGDEEHAFGCDLAGVSGVEEALGVDGFLCFDWVFVVAHEGVASAVADLS